MADSPRHQARMIVLQGLYAAEHNDEDSGQTFEAQLAEAKLAEKYVEFARRLFKLVSEKGKGAEKTLAELSEHWKLERIAAIDRLIICMALVEIEESPDVPVKVVINEAVELAKTYSTGDSYSFVNGILDRYARKIETDQAQG